MLDGPTHLSDGVVCLTLEQARPAEPDRDWPPEYRYGIFLEGSSVRVGEIRLRVGRNKEMLQGGNLGYEIAESHRGHHLAERACRLVAEVARHHRLDPLIITCDPANIASRRTCERLGATLLGVFDVPPEHRMYSEGWRQRCRYEWHPGRSPSPS